MTTKQIQLPPKLIPLFAPSRGELRYRGAKGGRGSGKSFTFAKMAAIWGAIEPLRILCTRELQNSIKESFHAEVKNAIASDAWLSSCYEVGVDFIRGKNGTEFMFKGLRHNIPSIKSIAQIDLCIIEEAETIPEASWLDLIPTIRAPKSEIWVIWNPKKDGSPVDQRLVKETPSKSKVITMNYMDNPWFPDELDQERKDNLKNMDLALYKHIWEGEYLNYSDAQIFNGKYRVAEFEPQGDWDGPYFGLDFGFAQDPTAATKSYISGNTLYIERESGEIGLDLDKTTAHLTSSMPDMPNYVIEADSARPESISYLKRHGLPKIQGVQKWKGSVEDGIEVIRSFDEVVIHTRCEQVQNEFMNYSYKRDRNTDEILPIIVDAHNHYIDSLRYALSKFIRNKNNKKGRALKQQAWG